MDSIRATEYSSNDHCSIDADAQIGQGATLGPYSTVSAGVSIGDDTRIGANVHIATGVRIGNAVLIGAHVVFAPALAAEQSIPAIVGNDVVIGAGSVICAGVVVAPKAFVRPGSVVNRSVPPAAIVEGNPATIIGYVDAHRGPAKAMQMAAASKDSAVETTAVRGVTVHTFPIIMDLRGDLTVGEFDKQIPFKPMRYFMVFGVPSREIRGEHAHRGCHQFLVCVRGSCAVVADDGTERVEVMLDGPNRGIYLPPMTWGIQYKYSADALLLVFASHHYDARDYVRDYAEFLALAAESGL